ncbi:uncharacterized protein LOC108911672 [Anoplophora glabripennis]|uniref:uncharacterized protein LOC108911672 n=1 Tax=Anoplophora glabripennis TaxID=217634 RepID=UPI000873620F|nr:uncharacterized protein LOC108911672 [Anoplophora glabripennis]
MILFYICGIAAIANGATIPLTNLLPPDFPHSSPSETEISAKLKGLYVPDNLEKLYDDGSDKSPPAPVPLANSPYGPVPAGSGLEGQYVADNLDKRYDPGLYTPDNLEQKFDNGLYKNENTPEPILFQSRFGLVPAGSGLEGQYADDEIEKQFDRGQYVDAQLEKRFNDGLYRGEPSATSAYNEVPHGLVSAGVGLVPSK